MHRLAMAATLCVAYSGPAIASSIDALQVNTIYKRVTEVLDTPSCNGSFTASTAGTSSCTDGLTQNGNVISGSLDARTGGDPLAGGDPTDPSIGVRASITAAGDSSVPSIGGSSQGYSVSHNVFDILHFGTDVTNVTLGFDVSGSLSAASSPQSATGGGGTGRASIQIQVSEWREGAPGVRLTDNSTNPITTLYQANASQISPGDPLNVTSVGVLGTTEVTFTGLTDGRLNLYTGMFATVGCVGRFDLGTTCSANSDFYGSAAIVSYVARNASGDVISTDVSSASGFNFEGLDGSGGGPAVIPLPASAWFLVAAMGSLLAMRRRAA